MMSGVVQLPEIAGEWDALAADADASPFARPGWVCAWADAFGIERDRLRIATARRDGELVGAVPMVAKGHVLVAPTNWHTPSFGALARDADARRAVWESVYAERSHAVEAGFLDEQETVLAVAAAHAAGRRVLVRTLTEPPAIALDGTFADYESGFSRNRRKSLRRLWRRLEAAGRVELEIHDTGADLQRRLDELYVVEASGWKGRAGTAIASAPDTRRFYDDVAGWAARHGWLRLSTLRLDGEAIASDLSLVHGGHWYSLKAGYLENWRAYGPGVLLLHRLVEHCYSDGLTHLELLGTADAFKDEWATMRRVKSHLAAFRQTPSGTARLATGTALQAARRARRALRSTA